MRKQIIAVLLLLCMTVSILPAFASTTVNSGTCGQSATWSFDRTTGTLSISGTGKMNNYQGVEMVDLRTQIKSGPAPWNSFASEIKTVVIAAGITSIGSYAFKGCNLTTISIPDSVSYIGLCAFEGCDNLKHVTIPDGVTELYKWTFEGCSSLTSISIPASVTAIYDYAFKGCSSLLNVSIPDHVGRIEQGTFQGCSSMTSVHIPESVLAIGRNAFDGCTNLMDIYYSGHKAQWSDINIVDALLVPLSTATIHYEGGTDPALYAPFQKTQTYTPGQFTDVPATSWYAEYVQSAYEYGMMDGVNNASFHPNGNLTVASAIAIACRLHSLYYKDNAVFVSGNPWYQSFVDYAEKNEIIDPTHEYAYDAPITRAYFATLISNALPDSALQEINEIRNSAIPDVTTGSPFMDAFNALANAGVLTASNAFQIFDLSVIYGNSLGIDNASYVSDSFQAIYRLYRAGVLTGNDKYGTFTPEANITRSAVAAIVSRVAEPALRQHSTLTPKPVKLVPMNQLQNLSSIRQTASNAELAQAYEAAKEIVEPLANLSREAQLCGIAIVLRIITENEVAYSMDALHYDDPYGFFNLHTASCAGCTRATGLCLNMLGISYEHINENAYSHQWTRVNVNGTYWICDAYGLYCGPEKEPYQHPKMS